MKLSFEQALQSLSDPDISIQEIAWAVVYAEVNPLLEHTWRQWDKLSADEGADVVAETWRKVWRASQKGEPPTDPDRFRAYVVTVSRNVMRDQWRSSRPMVRLDDPLFVRERSLLEDDSSLGVDANILTDSELRGLRDAVLQRLPPADAAIYELYVTGHSLSEITNILGMTRNAVDARMSRLRKRLRKMASAALLYRKLRPDETE